MTTIEDRIESGRVAFEIFNTSDSFTDTLAQYCVEKEGSPELYDVPEGVVKDMLTDIHLAEDADNAMGIGGLYEVSDLERLKLEAKAYLTEQSLSADEIDDAFSYAKHQAEMEMMESNLLESEFAETAELAGWA